MSELHPVLWRNHRDAIDRGYLEPGVSSAVGFPTGSGKSTVAVLKIGAVLLSQRSVVFLAPTHALVDQTRGSLAHAFPAASAVPKVRVNGRSEDVIFFDGVFFESSLKSIFFAS